MPLLGKKSLQMNPLNARLCILPAGVVNAVPMPPHGAQVDAQSVRGAVAARQDASVSGVHLETSNSRSSLIWLADLFWLGKIMTGGGNAVEDGLPVCMAKAMELMQMGGKSIVGDSGAML